MNQELALKLYVVLSKAYRTASDADKRQIRGYGLSSSEFAVLELLFHKGPQPIQQLASRILLTSGSMTYVISQLEKKGLVRRVASEADRRVFYAELTDDGTAWIKDIFPVHQDFMYNMMDGISEEDAETLIKLLKHLGKTIEGEVPV